MPTNFTVVPVDDAEAGSHSSAAAGSSKPSTLGQLFREEQDGDSSPEALTGKVRQQQTKDSSQAVGESFLERKHKLSSWLFFISGRPKEKRKYTHQVIVMIENKKRYSLSQGRVKTGTYRLKTKQAAMHIQLFRATVGVRKWRSVIDGCGSWPQ